MITWISPDCDNHKHDACNGDAWDFEEDKLTDCDCECHINVEDSVRNFFNKHGRVPTIGEFNELI